MSEGGREGVSAPCPRETLYLLQCCRGYVRRDARSTDRSGTIDLSELKAAIRLILDPQADKPFERLMMTEGSTLKPSLTQLRDTLSQQANRVIELFKKWDLDEDGMISLKEFKKALPELGFGSISPESAEELFHSMDRDGSGEISFNELHGMLRVTTDPLSGRSSPVAKQLPKWEPHDLDKLRSLMRLEVLKIGTRAELRSAIRSEEEWNDLGFPSGKEAAPAPSGTKPVEDAVATNKAAGTT